MKTDSNTEPRFLGLLAAAAFPGLGHMVAGEVARGFWVAVGVLGLFFGGMFVGGIDVIDSKDNRVWFIGQALVGPVAFGVDWVHQNQFKAYDPTARGIVNVAELARTRKRSAYPNEVRDTADISTNQGVVTVPIWVKVPPGTTAGPPNRTSIGRVNELGTLFATIAGMLNVIAVIDAGFPGRPKKPEKQAPTPGPGAPVVEAPAAASPAGGGQ